MNSRRSAALGTPVFAAASLVGSLAATGKTPAATAEMRVSVGDAVLYGRDVGRGVGVKNGTYLVL